MVTYQFGVVDRQMTAVSAEIEAITGYPQSDFLTGQHHLDDRIYPDDRNKKQHTMVFKLNQKSSYAIEYRIAHAESRILTIPAICLSSSV